MREEELSRRRGEAPCHARTEDIRQLRANLALLLEIMPSAALEQPAPPPLPSPRVPPTPPSQPAPRAPPSQQPSPLQPSQPSPRPLSPRPPPPGGAATGEELRLCSHCDHRLLRQYFSNTQWEKGGAQRRCISCINNSKTCRTCRRVLGCNAFSANQWKRPSAISNVGAQCKECTELVVRGRKRQEQCTKLAISILRAAPGGTSSLSALMSELYEQLPASREFVKSLGGAQAWTRAVPGLAVKGTGADGLFVCDIGWKPDRSDGTAASSSPAAASTSAAAAASSSVAAAPTAKRLGSSPPSTSTPLAKRPCLPPPPSALPSASAHASLSAATFNVGRDETQPTTSKRTLPAEGSASAAAKRACPPGPPADVPSQAVPLPQQQPQPPPRPPLQQGPQPPQLPRSSPPPPLQIPPVPLQLAPPVVAGPATAAGPVSATSAYRLELEQLFDAIFPRVAPTSERELVKLVRKLISRAPQGRMHLSQLCQILYARAPASKAFIAQARGGRKWACDRAGLVCGQELGKQEALCYIGPPPPPAPKPPPVPKSLLPVHLTGTNCCVVTRKGFWKCLVCDKELPGGRVAPGSGNLLCTEIALGHINGARHQKQLVRLGLAKLMPRPLPAAVSGQSGATPHAPPTAAAPTPSEIAVAPGMKAAVALGFRATQAAAISAAHASVAMAAQTGPSKHAEALSGRATTFFSDGRTDASLSSLDAAINVLSGALGGSFAQGGLYPTLLAALYATRSLLRSYMACASADGARSLREARCLQASKDAQKAMVMAPDHPLPPYSLARAQLAVAATGVGPGGPSRSVALRGVAIQTLRRFATRPEQAGGSARSPAVAAVHVAVIDLIKELMDMQGAAAAALAPAPPPGPAPPAPAPAPASVPYFDGPRWNSAAKAPGAPAPLSGTAAAYLAQSQAAVAVSPVQAVELCHQRAVAAAMAISARAPGPASVPAAAPAGEARSPGKPAPPLEAAATAANADPQVDTDLTRIARRQKQIASLKNKPLYERYAREVPRSQRPQECPRTPDATQMTSKREFCEQIASWNAELLRYVYRPKAQNPKAGGPSAAAPPPPPPPLLPPPPPPPPTAPSRDAGDRRDLAGHRASDRQAEGELEASLPPRPCKYMAACRYRRTCSYHHRSRPMPDGRCVPNCACNSLTCELGHPLRSFGPSAEFASHPNFKTRLCLAYASGNCQHGASCSFAHGEGELRRPPAASRGPPPAVIAYRARRADGADLDDVEEGEVEEEDEADAFFSGL